MKLLFFNDFRLGVLNGDTVVDVSDAVREIPRQSPQDLIRGVIERFDTLRRDLEAASQRGGGTPLASVRVRAPLPKPANIICMAVNYLENSTQLARYSLVHRRRYLGVFRQSG